jgi:hypothetical protein
MAFFTGRFTFFPAQGNPVTAKVTPEGALVVTASGAARTVVPKMAAKTWVLKDGKTVLYSLREMKIGYEGEGETLFRYDPATGKRERLLTAHYIIDKVYELTTARGKTLLCVTMMDGGLGANHVALVHPDRGTVFQSGMSRFAKVEPNRIVVAEWGDADLWHDSPDNPRGKPTRYYTFDPDRVLTRRATRN